MSGVHAMGTTLMPIKTYSPSLAGVAALVGAAALAALMLLTPAAAQMPRDVPAAPAQASEVPSPMPPPRALVPAISAAPLSVTSSAGVFERMLDTPGYFNWSALAGGRDSLRQLYADPNRLLWVTGGRPTAAAIALLQELRNAADRGLDPEDYPGNRLDYLLLARSGAQTTDAAPWALFDAGLSYAGMRLIADLHFGRIDPAAVGHHLSVEHGRLDLAAAVSRLAAADDVAATLDAFEPQFKHFALLKRQLAQYRLLADDPGINMLPPLPGKSVKPGEAYAGAAQLQRLLVALGDQPPPPASAPAPDSLTPALAAALQDFQRRHGQTPDGVLGRAAYVALTRPLSERVRQIVLTLERWRWMPPTLDSAPLIVNIPQFRLFAFASASDAEAHAVQMDVIVGKAFHSTQTPVFAADMTYVVFRPYWEVPNDIAVREILPKARVDPTTIAAKQMEIVDGYGDTARVYPNSAESVERVARGELRLRQKPGDDNSLGLVKFMLPNQYNVYLHSTPAKALFAESRRDFSHGCVRVGDPVGLAEYVLRNEPQWTRERILAAMNGAGSVTVTLHSPIRVFIVYGTAVATESGAVYFFDDIYGHDTRLEKALAARSAHLQSQAL
jgi:murein L,D-transpeptidase YcbB/YkuD